MKQQSLTSQIETQVDAISRFYANHIQKSAELEQENTSGTFAQRISGWFMGNKRTQDAPIHQNFLPIVEKLVGKLNDLLAQVEEPAVAAKYAMQAVDIIVDPVPDDLRDTGGWVRFAAEVLCQPLLVYLTHDQLLTLQQRYLRYYNVNRFFPNQKAFYKALTSLLSK